MTADPPAGNTAPHFRRSRLPLFAGLGLLVLVVLGVVWIVVTGLLARRDVDRVRGDLAALEADFVAGRETAAATLVHSMQGDATAAHTRTTGPAWWLAAQIPGLGQPLDTSRQATTLLQAATRDVLPPVGRAAQALDPPLLRTGTDAIDLTRLTQATAPLQAADDATKPVLARSRALPSGGWLSTVTNQRNALVDDLSRLQHGLSLLTTASRLLPEPLGADGVRRYFVAFENDAEARGIGGLPGSFALLTADHGRIRLSHFSSDDALIGTHATVNLGRAFHAFYGSDPEFNPETDIRDSDRSPHFPDAAKIWMSMWQQRYHQRLDGAIATDPATLGYLLGATGSVTLANGNVLNSSDSVKFFESVIYQAFAHDLAGRKAYQNLAARAIASHVLSASSQQLPAVAGALQRAASQRRLLVYTGDPAVESAIARSPVSGTIPQTTRPFLDVVVNNISGTKLDYYLDRTVTYSRKSCAAGPATVTVTLHNGAPKSGLPPYVVAKGASYAPPIAGESYMLVSLYSTAHASVNRAQLDGKVAYISSDSEQGHPVTTTEVDLLPGQTQTLTFYVHEPTATGQMIALSQPLVRPLVQRLRTPSSCE